MKPIQMVDLINQYNVIKTEIDTAIQKVINSTAFINGQDVKKFAKELAQYLSVKHVIPCGNGTDALQASFMALDLKQGDEVLTPSFTFIATVEVIAFLGLKPVLIDADPDTFNIDVNQIEKAITKKTKAILPVHLFGQCAYMEKIIEIARKYNLYIIEDAAQAIGADYYTKDKSQKAGTLGNAGCTSFFPSKNLGCYGDGGAIYTNDDDIAEKLHLIVSHGMKQKYYYETVGINSRLDSIQAAILRVKLKKLDYYIRKRIKVSDFYDNAFSDCQQLIIPARVDYSNHVFHQYTLKLKNVNREEFKSYLQKHGIPSMIYYPVPVHTQKGYQFLGYKEGDFPAAEELCKTVISLPMHTELDKEQLNYITGTVLNYFK